MAARIASPSSPGRVGAACNFSRYSPPTSARASSARTRRSAPSARSIVFGLYYFTDMSATTPRRPIRSPDHRLHHRRPDHRLQYVITDLHRLVRLRLAAGLPVDRPRVGGPFEQLRRLRPAHLNATDALTSPSAAATPAIIRKASCATRAASITTPIRPRRSRRAPTARPHLDPFQPDGDSGTTSARRSTPMPPTGYRAGGSFRAPPPPGVPAGGHRPTNRRQDRPVHCTCASTWPASWTAITARSTSARSSRSAAAISTICDDQRARTARSRLRGRSVIRSKD